MIIFYHCHKAGGTTIVRAAEKSGLILPERHKNGNPLNDRGKAVRWSKMSDQECIDLLLELKEQGVQFMCFEFDAPKWEVVQKIPDVRVFTVLREPISRAFSNYKMSIITNPDNAEKFFGLSVYLDNTGLFRSNNYYVKFFSRSEPDASVTDDHYYHVIRLLSKFDDVFILERKDHETKLLEYGFDADAFGWKNANVKRKGFNNLEIDTDLIEFGSMPTHPDLWQNNLYDVALYAYFMQRTTQSASPFKNKPEE